MPGNLRKKPSKPNKDFAERQWWRTWSALLLPLPLPLSTGSLGCIMSCILIHNEWRIGEVPMQFFFCLFSTFQISIFFVIHFVTAVRVSLSLSTPDICHFFPLLRFHTHNVHWSGGKKITFAISTSRLPLFLRQVIAITILCVFTFL